MMHKVLEDPEVKLAISSRYNLIEVDVDKNKQYGIRSIPAFRITDKTGLQLKFAVGYMDKQTFLKWIKL